MFLLFSYCFHVFPFFFFLFSFPFFFSFFLSLLFLLSLVSISLRAIARVATLPNFSATLVSASHGPGLFHVVNSIDAINECQSLTKGYARNIGIFSSPRFFILSFVLLFIYIYICLIRRASRKRNGNKTIGNLNGRHSFVLILFIYKDSIHQVFICSCYQSSTLAYLYKDDKMDHLNRVNFNYSTKNIPIPSRNSFKSMHCSMVLLQSFISCLMIAPRVGCVKV